MRTLSVSFREALHAQETGEVVVVLLTIEHPDLPEPLRFSSDPTQRTSEAPLTYGTVSRGETYLFVPFSFVLPDEQDETPPQAKITLDNIGRETVALLRSTLRPAQVTLEIVLGSALDDVEIEVPTFDLSAAEYDATSITLTLSIDALVTEPYPAGTFSPASFPSLF